MGTVSYVADRDCDAFELKAKSLGLTRLDLGRYGKFYIVDMSEESHAAAMKDMMWTPSDRKHLEVVKNQECCVSLEVFSGTSHVCVDIITIDDFAAMLDDYRQQLLKLRKPKQSEKLDYDQRS